MSAEWLNQYRVLMFGRDHTYDTMTEGAKLKFVHLPAKLFKYRVLNDHTWDDLSNDTLFVRKTSVQNDTREANIILTPDAETSIRQQLFDDMTRTYGLPRVMVKNADDVIVAINDYFKRFVIDGDAIEKEFVKTPQYESLRKQIDESFKAYICSIKNNSREIYSICSFSSVNNSNLMWGYYADGHKGCCIEYNFKELGSEALDVALMFPVLYTEDNRVYLNKYEIDKGVDGSLAMFAATLKNKEWEHEKEWRRLYLGTESGKLQKMPKPTAVYMGERINQENRARLIELCKERGIKLFQTHYEQSQDSIVSYPLDL